MSYHHARDAFQEAQRHMTKEKEPILWDLAVGVGLLVSAIEEDMQRIHDQVDELARRVSR